MKTLTWKEAGELAIKILHEAEQRRLKAAEDEARRTSVLWDEE